MKEVREVTMRLGETVDIVDNVTITVVKVQGKYAKLGVDAPKNIIVHREEIYRRVKLDQEVATANASGER
ncbi:MAG: carbon storage regulator [Pseudomonadales bacterium]|nr:carbon storage regulator [Pseudomonadales bacterium]